MCILPAGKGMTLFLNLYMLAQGNNYVWETGKKE